MSIRPTEIRVAVLKGGRSAEREVSLNTGAQVSAALAESGFDVAEFDTGDDEFVVELVRSEADVAFICLHGRFGEHRTGAVRAHRDAVRGQRSARERAGHGQGDEQAVPLACQHPNA